MKRRSGSQGDADMIHIENPAPDPTDIFAGVKQENLPTQAQITREFNNSNVNNSTRISVPSLPKTVNQQELPLNRLVTKYPRFFWYVAIVILGIIIGILLGRKL